MKECTLALMYLVKWAELGCTIAWVVYTFINGLAFVSKAQWAAENGSTNSTTTTVAVYMTYVALVLCCIHLFYMNLLINARFFLALSCQSCCKPCWTL